MLGEVDCSGLETFLEVGDSFPTIFYGSLMVQDHDREQGADTRFEQSSFFLFVKGSRTDEAIK